MNKLLLSLAAITSVLLACNRSKGTISFNHKIDSATNALVAELKARNLDVIYPADNRANCFRVGKPVFEKVANPLMDQRGLAWIADNDSITYKVVIYGFYRKKKILRQ